MRFNFKAKISTGEIREGTVEAINSEAAIMMIQERGMVPITVTKQKEVSELMKEIGHLWEGVSARELAVFFRQLATLVDARVSITTSLKAISDQSDNVYLRIIILEMINDIEDGLPLSESMGKHPEVFKPLAVSMVKAGELSGNLQRSVTFLADNTEKNYELTSKIRGAMFYPAFVLIATLGIGFAVFTFILPKLTIVFKDFNVPIPWYTKVIMVIGDFMQAYWWVVLFGLAGIVGAFMYYIKTEDGRKEWDVIKTKIPIVGKLFQDIYISRFAENLAVLLNGGIPIVRALMIVSEVVNNTAYESVILKAADEVKVGGAMSSVFARTDQFPPIVAQMIKIEEESGKISEVLKNISDFYILETDRITRNLSSMLEPVLISILGVGVAIIVFAVLVPIYNIAGSIQ
jgi:type II secretory pathway component PulF